MILPAKIDSIVKSEFTLTAGAAHPAQQVRYNLNPTWPLDMVLLVLTATQNATTAPTTIAGDGFLNALKRVQLTVNDGTSRNVIDISGASLLDYAWNVFGMLDNSTLYQYCHVPVANATPKTAFAIGEVVKICYPIFLAHPQLVDPLRLFTLLPCHRHKADPVLTLDFSSYAELNLNQAMVSWSFELVTVGREMPKEVDDMIMSRGGYLGYDLMETETAVATDNTDQRIEIPSPGKYSGLLIRGYTDQYLRGDITKTTTDTWRIDQGGVIPRRWKCPQLAMLNDLSRATAPVPTANPWYPYGSYFLDFLSDVVGTDVNELGSLLDTERYGPTIRTYLGASMDGGTYNKVKTIGHRFYGDVNRFKVTSAQTAKA